MIKTTSKWQYRLPDISRTSKKEGLIASFKMLLICCSPSNCFTSGCDDIFVQDLVILFIDHRVDPILTALVIGNSFIDYV